MRLFLIGFVLCIVGCGEKPAAPVLDRHRLTQVSIINALMVGRYDGITPLSELLKHGDFGLGTCDHLDGEMIVLDGKAYKITSEGKVVELPGTETTPFAVVTPFDAQVKRELPAVGSLEELDARLDGLLTDPDLFYAIRIEGEFDALTVRSVARQNPPYKPLPEVAASQRVWQYEKVRGTLLGFRSPKWTSGLTVPGYHWHFLADDRTRGGHVLDCEFAAATLAYDRCESWTILLNPTMAVDGADLSTDRSKALREVESKRGETK
ncbi:MAG: acetolactate decarboxylase [Pirellulales bacterium]